MNPVLWMLLGWLIGSLVSLGGFIALILVSSYFNGTSYEREMARTAKKFRKDQDLMKELL